MKRLIPLAAVAALALAGAASAKTVTYVETVTRADGSQVVTITKVRVPSEVQVTRASLERSLLRSNLR
ncbi:hypothetical protein BDE40_0542 [Litoreibacter halocynthiae]|uniref:Uncharacterized protein n=2 Tax=Litoreibacter TaxID=947567 RepID=A0A4R7LR27_9RHOB|nr:hypothetical protein [Litoreibacter]TDT77262.1 hypothetical protein BDE40_0542 [Litoreibacter halocynthiae]SHF77411.1 hypothetical protein SAMN05444273_11216 [Litoreibacter ascidiaceicola]